MRILIVSYYFPPYMNVGGFRALSWARRFHDRGHELVVISGEGKEVDSCACFPEELGRPIRVHRVRNPLLAPAQDKTSAAPAEPGPRPRLRAPTFVYKAIWKTKEALRNAMPLVDSYMLWARAAAAKALEEARQGGPFDAVISTSFPLAAHEVARRLKKKTGCLWIGDFRDFFGQSDSYRLPVFSARGLFLRARFRSYGRELDLPVTVSSELGALVGAALGRDDVMILLNGYFAERIPPRAGGKPAWRIFYVGSYNPDENNLEPLCTALVSLRAEGRELPEICFTGAQNQAVSSAFAEHGIPVRFIGYMANREAMLQEGDSSFLLLCDSMSGPGTLFTKTYEYLAARRPIIILSREGSALDRSLFKEKAEAYCLSLDAMRIADFIKAWDDRYLEGRFDEGFYTDEYIAGFSRERQADRLIERIESLRS